MKTSHCLLSALLGLAGCQPHIHGPMNNAAAQRETPYRIGVQLVVHALPPTTAHFDDDGVYHVPVGDELQATARYIPESEDYRPVTDNPNLKWLLSDPPRLTEVPKKPGRFKAVSAGTVRVGCVFTDPTDHEKYFSNTIEVVVEPAP